MQNYRTCITCQKEKPESEFPQSRGKSIKLIKPKNTGSYCKQCNAERSREWRRNNPGYRTTGKVVALPKEERPWMSAVRQRLSDAHQRCKKLNKPAPEITDTFLYDLLIKQGKKCALTGAEFILETRHPLCLSLDQKDPALGYVEGNVQWLAWCVNRAKGDLDLDDFFDMCAVIVEKRNVQRLSREGVRQKSGGNTEPLTGSAEGEDIV